MNNTATLHQPHGALNVYSMVGTRHKIEVEPERVKELAARGLNDREIAKALGVCYGTLRRNIAESEKVRRARIAGRKAAGTYKNEQDAAVADDEGVVLLQYGDEEVVLKALKRKTLHGTPLPAGKRMRHLKDITGWDVSALVRSLERLVVHLLVEEIPAYSERNNTPFTQYAAIEPSAEKGGEIDEDED